MTSTDFKNRLDDFLFNVLESKTYKEYLKNKERMEKDEHLTSLSKKRQNDFLLASETDDSKKKREYYLSFSSLTDQIKDDELFKNYNSSYKELEEVLRIVQEGIISKIR